MTDLLKNLRDRTQFNLKQVSSMHSSSLDTLNWKADTQSWSALECIEHLNRYGRFYLPEIAQRIKNGRKRKVDVPFRSGWLGNHFATSMLPSSRMRKMGTLKSMNPNGSKLDKTVLDEFISQQQEMLQLLADAEFVDLNKTKTSISISKIVKLRLGDTFRIVVYHNQRHIAQALKAIKN